MQEVEFYRRNLPHFQSSEGIYFVTFRLANSLPKHIIDRLKIEYGSSTESLKKINNLRSLDKTLYLRQKRYFGKFDSLLDSSKIGPLWLKNDNIARTVSNSINYYNHKKYFIYSYSVMPNHIHMLFELLHTKEGVKPVESKFFVTEILKSIKINSALKANKILNRSGQFWHRESFDHVVRNEREFENIMKYILMNPQKAGLVKNWKDWKWTYCYLEDGI